MQIPGIMGVSYVRIPLYRDVLLVLHPAEAGEER
jgi:hypothetical protein